MYRRNRISFLHGVVLSAVCPVLGGVSAHQTLADSHRPVIGVRKAPPISLRLNRMACGKVQTPGRRVFLDQPAILSFGTNLPAPSLPYRCYSRSSLASPAVLRALNGRGPPTMQQSVQSLS